MILNNWRGYDIKILNRTSKGCKVELFNNSDQHFVVYYLKNKGLIIGQGLTDEEINNNIMNTIKKNGHKKQ
jgi:hypothetical protein